MLKTHSPIPAPSSRSPPAGHKARNPAERTQRSVELQVHIQASSPKPPFGARARVKARVKIKVSVNVRCIGHDTRRRRQRWMRPERRAPHMHVALLGSLHPRSTISRPRARIHGLLLIMNVERLNPRARIARRPAPARYCRFQASRSHFKLQVPGHTVQADVALHGPGDFKAPCCAWLRSTMDRRPFSPGWRTPLGLGTLIRSATASAKTPPCTRSRNCRCIAHTSTVVRH